MQRLPLGEKLTSESLKFFSPIVIRGRFSSSQEKHDILFFAFTEYHKVSTIGAWLSLMNKEIEETDFSQICLNRETQHSYLTWRANKDVVENFLFNGVNELGNKT